MQLEGLLSQSARLIDSHPGELAGIGAAFTWAIGSLVYSRFATVPPSALNLFKNSMATMYFLVAVILAAFLRPSTILAAGSGTWGTLALSAVIGIVLGDTFYFRSLQILGPRRALVLTTFAPVFSALLGFFLPGERVGEWVWGGMGVTLSGVLIAVSCAREISPSGEGDRPVSPWTGIACGILASLCQAFGAVFSKRGMVAMDPLEASFIRLAVAAAAGFAIGAGTGRLSHWRERLFARGFPAPLAVASFFSTFLGIWGSLIAFHNTKIAVATTLTSMSPVFVLPLAFIFLRERAPWAAILGAFLAVGGVVLLF